MHYAFSFPFALICALIGYILGNLQSAVIVSRLKFKQDIRNYGSHNAGTTNMLRTYGLKPGTLTLAGDFLKAVAAVLLGRAFMSTAGGYIAAFFVVLGHCFPVLAGFRGGKGAACFLGIGWTVFPLAAALVTVAAVVAFLLWERMSVCSLIGGTLFLILVLLTKRGDPLLIVLTILLYLILVLRHRENIERLISGKEPRMKIKR